MRPKNIFFWIGLFLSGMLTSGFTQNNDAPWPFREKLTYKVSWSFIRLGTLKFVIQDTLRMNGKRVYHAKLFIDSNPTLIFINHHSVYETYFDDDLNVHLFKYDETVDDIRYHATYRYDYADSLIYVNYTNEKDPLNQIKKVNPFCGHVIDGMSLIYYIRTHAHKTCVDTIRYLMDGGEDMAILDFRGAQNSLKIKVVKSAIPVTYFEGCILGEGIAGLKGDFKGWLSAGHQRVPMRAELKVTVGSVVLELEAWDPWYTKRK